MEATTLELNLLPAAQSATDVAALTAETAELRTLERVILGNVGGAVIVVSGDW